MSSLRLEVINDPPLRHKLNPKQRAMKIAAAGPSPSPTALHRSSVLDYASST